MLLILEGFDGGGTALGDAGFDEMIAYLQARYASISSGSGDNRIVTQEGWGSGFALSWGNETLADNNFIDMSVGDQTEIFVGFAIKPKQTITITSETLLEFRDVGGGNIRDVTMQVFNGSTIKFLRNTTAIAGATAPAALHQNRWSYVEIRVVLSNTVGVIECRVNGVEVINVTGIDTLESTSTKIDTVRFSGGKGQAFGGTVAEQWLLDDVYILDTVGTTNITFLGPIKIETLFPNAEGATINFTPSTGTDNSANVDENPRDDDTTYNSSADTASNKDLLAATNLSVVTGGIVGLQVTSDAKLDSAGSIGLQSIVAEGTPTQGTGDIVEITSTTDYVAVQHIFETNPDTAAAWAVAEVDAMEIGYEVD